MQYTKGAFTNDVIILGGGGGLEKMTKDDGGEGGVGLKIETICIKNLSRVERKICKS